MLELYEYDAYEDVDEIGGVMAFLNEAADVRVTKEINTADELTFTYPLASDKAELITVNRIVLCEGQPYRIMRVSRGGGALTVECMHVWYADAPAAHIPSVPDSIGVKPYDFVRSVAESSTRFTALTQSQVQSLGLNWIGKGDFMKNKSSEIQSEFKIDFFALDKTNLLDFIKTVIENAGFGEMYYESSSFAVVEQLGKTTCTRLELSSNMENVRVETDISSMITRLYPYGYDDMTIGSVYGQNFVDSPNLSRYGLKSGYKDYSDYTDVYDLYANAQWEFDSQNLARIDVPSVSVTGSVHDLARYTTGDDIAEAQLGDVVTVVDEAGTEIRERIIAVSYYPYENRPADMTIGRVKHDLYFYISQISEIAKKYSKCSTTSGKINAKAISGAKAASYATARTIGLEYKGEVRSITAGEDGVYIDGRKIITEGVAEETG